MVAGQYLRADVNNGSNEALTESPTDVGRAEQVLEFTFLDLYERTRNHTNPSASMTEQLTAVVQDRLHHLSSSDCLLIRWPWLTQHDDGWHEAEICRWLDRLSGEDGDKPVVGAGVKSLGVLRHRIGSAPTVLWARDAPVNGTALVHKARALELHALLQRRDAIWQPATYHYRLPSGEHTAIFVRAADALHSPQDVSALACWLVPYLSDGVGVLVDTAGLTPLLLQIDNILWQNGMRMGSVAILPQYPTGRPSVRRAVEEVLQPPINRVLALQSVSATSGLQRTLSDELERAAENYGLEDCTFEILVDRVAQADACEVPIKDGRVQISTWLRLGHPQATLTGSACDLCRSADKAQVVAINPRSYGPMTLPTPHLVMPDVAYAQDAHLFWECAAQTHGLAIEANPHPASKTARGKRTALPVRPILELIASFDELGASVEKQQRHLQEKARHLSENEADVPLQGSDVGLVVAAKNDLASVPLPDFAGEGNVDLKPRMRIVLSALGVDESVQILAEEDPVLEQAITDLPSERSVLAFSWGTVTGLTLRQLKVAIAERLRNLNRDIRVDAMVLHSRPTSPREWTAMQNQFRPGRLWCLWTSCLPWASPLQDEHRLLDRSGIDPLSLSDQGQRFLSMRRHFLEFHSTFQDQDDDWSPRFRSEDAQPDPAHVFWGMSEHNIHQEAVRGRSLYGNNLDCTAAYAAIGAVTNYTRFAAQPDAAPRWVMFDLGRIVRSYFDAVITCALIRWLHPGELWWELDAGGPDSARDSVAFLIDQADGVPDEQVLLLPELLLAAAQGKVPAVARGLLCERARSVQEDWPNDPSFDLPRGAIEVGLKLLDSSS